VDLYFLLKKFSVSDLYRWSRLKFKREYDLMLFASDLVKIDGFDYLPRMVEKITLDELKDFYCDLAKDIGFKATKH
jgi:hypothetical protein